MAKKGRPQGSKNNEYVHVQATAAACVACGGNDIKPVAGSKPIDQEYAGVTPSGVSYRGIRKQRCICECGQHLMLKTYRLAKDVQKQNTKTIKTRPQAK